MLRVDCREVRGKEIIPVREGGGWVITTQAAFRAVRLVDITQEQV